MSGSFIQELMRRKVFRVAAAYLVVAWVLLQVVATVAPILDLPNWISRAALVLLALGFPVSIVLAWAFELTPDGIKRDASRNQAEPGGNRKVELLIIAVLSFTVVYFAADKFVLTDNEPTATTEIGKSVAVLVFDNLSGDTANDPFTLGIHDDLLTSISRIGSIKTISRTSVLQYRGTTKTIPEIARELGVATILEGGIQRSGNRVRINAQLIDASVDEHLWAETYDRELTAENIFAIQSEIATAIANALRATLTEDEQNACWRIAPKNRCVPLSSISKRSSIWIRILHLHTPVLRTLTCCYRNTGRVRTGPQLLQNRLLPLPGLCSLIRNYPKYSTRKPGAG